LCGSASLWGGPPPDYLSFALNNELGVQTAGGPLGGGVATTPGIGVCGVGSQVCDPAVLSVNWTTAGTTTPFTSFSNQSFTVDLANTAIMTATLQIGPETLTLASLPSSPVIVPTSVVTTETFAPRYSWGNPATAATTANVTSTTSLSVTSSFSAFFSGVSATLGSTDPARQLMARGIYDRATNTFTATQIDFAL
jgi:hypothetical protein